MLLSFKTFQPFQELLYQKRGQLPNIYYCKSQYHMFPFIEQLKRLRLRCVRRFFHRDTARARPWNTVIFLPSVFMSLIGWIFLNFWLWNKQILMDWKSNSQTWKSSSRFIISRSLKKLVLILKIIFVRMITLNFGSMISLLVCTSFQEFQKIQNLTQKPEEKSGYVIEEFSGCLMVSN